MRKQALAPQRTPLARRCAWLLAAAGLQVLLPACSSPPPRATDQLRATQASAPPATAPTGSAPSTTAPSPLADDDATRWRDRLAALRGASWDMAFSLGCELADLPPDRGFERLRENWDALPAPVARQQMLKAFYLAPPMPLRARNHARIVDVLHLGAADADPQVRNWTFRYLRAVAFDDFEAHAERYAAWHVAARAAPLAEVLQKSAATQIDRLAAAGDASNAEVLAFLADISNTIGTDPLLRRIVIAENLPALLLRAIEKGAPQARAPALLTLRALRMDEAWLRAHVLPIITSNSDGELRSAAIRLLGAPGNTWAVEPLIQILADATAQPNGRDAIWMTAAALGDVGDFRAIPPLIGALAADNVAPTIEQIGRFGLGRLTTVAFDASHDAGWWRRWWELNRSQFADDVRDSPIPEYPRVERPVAAGAPRAPEPDELFDVPAQQIAVSDNAEMQYVLIGPKVGAKVPASGWPLLVVLPGGEGGAEMVPFVRRIAKYALPQDYLVVQLLAREWKPGQKENLVWPTRAAPADGMKYATEDYALAAIRDARRRYRIDPDRIFTLGWSSGGPPCYALSATDGSPITGTFVAMSIFRAGLLPHVELARGHAYYLMHSPQDGIPIAMARAARQTLVEAGAQCELIEYEGGHGWHGDVYGSIQAGIQWLERNHGQPR